LPKKVPDIAWNPPVFGVFQEAAAGRPLPFHGLCPCIVVSGALGV
jgi:hypothetical protein